MLQIQNYRRLGFTAILASGLATTMIALATSSAFAQQVTTSKITVRTTGAISGTLELPSFNPNFGDPRNPTRVNTDANGIYYRNIGTKGNPNLVKVYQSPYVVTVNKDGTLASYVDFLGIPVTSFDAVITSPALSDGEMETFKYDGKLEGARIKGVVKDEFGVKKSYYTGIVTDPETGIQYKGTFKVTGVGPRYSDRNGGDSPTVFDFKSDIPGSPTVKSFKIKDNSPLTKLYINVPVGTEILTPSTGNTPPTSTGGSSTPPPTSTTPPSTPSTNLTPPSTTPPSTPSTNLTPPSTTPPSTPSTNLTPPSTTPTSTPSTNLTPPSTTPPSTPSTNLAPSSSPITSSASNNLVSPDTPITSSPSATPIPFNSNDSIPPVVNKVFNNPGLSISTPSTISNVEFSDGSSFSGSFDFTNSLSRSQNNREDIQTSTSDSISKSKNQGPRSRVMMP
ncbi:MAG: hypothetical protein AAFS12_05465 [Cyanobacteria bacterium J06632_19]